MHKLASSLENLWESAFDSYELPSDNSTSILIFIEEWPFLGIHPSIMQFLSLFQKTLLDSIFPIHCISCQSGKAWICKDCFSKIPLQIDQVCPICEKSPTPDGQTCFSCQNKSNLDGLFVSASYKNELVSTAIKHYKYKFIEDLYVPLGEMLITSLRYSNLALPDIILPVPLHPRRLRWRGYNQAELLANFIGKNILENIDVPIETSALIRKKYSIPQMSISDYAKRKENIRNIFLVENKEKIKDKYIWLVDDVATTSSTLLECAKTLKKSGAKKVFGVVIARQEMKKSD